jgi:predicted nuclease of predicted toxin-antitoxin system
MNLSPDSIPVLTEAGFDAIHWSSVGEPQATDAVIMGWAREHDRVVFTDALDFGILLSNSHSAKPSVLQARTQDVTPVALSAKAIATLRQHHSALMAGAIVVLDEHRSRVRILPLN